MLLYEGVCCCMVIRRTKQRHRTCKCCSAREYHVPLSAVESAMSQPQGQEVFEVQSCVFDIVA